MGDDGGRGDGFGGSQLDTPLTLSPAAKISLSPQLAPESLPQQAPPQISRPLASRSSPTPACTS
ncbi:hypothetical protein AAG906_035745 [Vitis piasezkii]